MKLHDYIKISLFAQIKLVSGGRGKSEEKKRLERQNQWNNYMEKAQQSYQKGEFNVPMFGAFNVSYISICNKDMKFFNYGSAYASVLLSRNVIVVCFSPGIFC